MASAVRSRTHSFGHPLASAVRPLPLTLPFLIPIKYLTLSTSPSQVSSFGHPVTRTTLNPVLTLLPPVPTNTGSFGYYSQYPSSVPHPIIRGPSSPSDAIPTIKKMSYWSFVHYRKGPVSGGVTNCSKGGVVVTFLNFLHLVHVPMSLRARTSALDEWLRLIKCRKA